MEVSISVRGDGVADEVRSLYGWLVDDGELRGRVRLVEQPPETGALGAMSDAVAIAVGPGGVATAVAAVVITWIRHRTSEIAAKVSRPDGTEVDVKIDHVRAANVDDVHRLITELARQIDPDENTDARDEDGDAGH